MIVTGNVARILHASKSVGTTATLLACGTETMDRRTAIYIFNNGLAIIYIGGSNVTTSNGIPVPPNGDFLIQTGTDLYAVAASGTVDVRIMEVGG